MTIITERKHKKLIKKTDERAEEAEARPLWVVEDGNAVVHNRREKSTQHRHGVQLGGAPVAAGTDRALQVAKSSTQLTSQVE